MGGTSGVLCRYYLYGACKLGADCAFSHNLDDAESQVGQWRSMHCALQHCMLTFADAIQAPLIDSI
jgi:hypothetical protein